MIEQVPAAAWEEWVRDNDAVILDVREPQEWAATGVLPGSMEVALMTLPMELARFDKETPILVVCRSGNRSQNAAAFLVQNGYQAANLAGGLVALGMAW